jgi:uncharacterized protein YvpB
MHSPSRSVGKTRILLSLLAFAGLAAALLRPTAVEAHGSEVIIEGMPAVKQWYNLSCEYAAAAAVTLFWGGELVSQDHFIREVPQHPNPHKGFRGNIHGVFGGITDYGVYAEPLVPVLEQHGYDASVFYGGAERLKAEIEAGHPIVVWLTAGRAERPVYQREFEGETFKLVPSEHTVVAYGYDDGGAYLMDVGDGGRYYADWDSFLRRWGYFDQMALLIHPRSTK